MKRTALIVCVGSLVTLVLLLCLFPFAAAADTRVVVNASDSGPGSLREHMENAKAGDVILFHGAVFPSDHPTWIGLQSALPPLDDGNVTIDATNEGVGLDGGPIGSSPQQSLIDEVTLSIDGGPNLLQNSGFEEGAAHWRAWDVRGSAARTIEAVTTYTPTAAYAAAVVAHGAFGTVYDASGAQEPIDDSDWYEDTSADLWLTVAPGEEGASASAVVSLWHKGGPLVVRLRTLTDSGVPTLAEQEVEASAVWVQAVLTMTLPSDVIKATVEIQHKHTLAGENILTISSDGNTVRGLAIASAPGSGIHLDQASDNVIGGDRAIGEGPLGQGCRVLHSEGAGIWVGADSHRNVISGNYIGTDDDGVYDLSNREHGILIDGQPSSTYNVIGGSTVSTGNLISGNDGDGVALRDGAAFNTLLGNLIGVDATGTVAIANAGHGISLGDGAHDNVIGGAASGEGNVIAYNGICGIATQDDALRNTWSRNLLRENAYEGIRVAEGTQEGIQAPQVLASDLGVGTATGTACADCVVELYSTSDDEGNVYEATTVADASGAWSIDLGRAMAGPYVLATATDPNGNSSAYSHRSGVACVVASAEDSGPGTLRACMENVQRGDLIRFDETVFPAGTPVTIALKTRLPEMMIGNVTIDGSDNWVVLDGSGLGNAVIPNLVDDVSLAVDGGPNVLQNSSFSQNDDHWRAWDARASAPRRISTSDTHTEPGALACDMTARGEIRTVYDHSGSNLPLDGDVSPYSAESTVWVPVTGQRAVMRMWHKGNRVEARVRALVDGVAQRVIGHAMDETSGEWVEEAISFDLPEGTTAIALELGYFHLNSWDRAFCVHSDYNTIKGMIGFGFPADGMDIIEGSHNTIGGRRDVGAGPTGEGCLFSGNDLAGIAIASQSHSNVIQGCIVGLDETGQAAWANELAGIRIWGQSIGNIIGGDEPALGNVISGNDGEGILSYGDGVSGTQIIGNLIGTDVSGTAPFGNASDGIRLVGGTKDTRIGGPESSKGNIVTYNGGSGVSLYDDVVGTIVQSNRIGIDTNGSGGILPRDLAISPDGTLYMADAVRGVCTSVDGAESWTCSHVGIDQPVNRIAVSADQASEGMVWAAGETKLYVSDDRGDTFAAVGDGLPNLVNALAVSPTFAQDRLVLAQVRHHGLYRSTDGGQTWDASILSEFAASWANWAVAFSPNYASDGLILASGQESALYRSTDGGQTWQSSDTGLPEADITDIAISADGQIVFVTTHGLEGASSVYRSDDAGMTWAGQGEGIDEDGPSWQVALSPEYLVDQTVLVAEDELYRSADDGVTWAESGDGLYGYRAFGLVFSPSFSSDRTAYCATAAGVFRSADGGQTWAWAAADLADQGNAGRGIDVFADGLAPRIMDNVIGGNQLSGVRLEGDSASGTLLSGNLIGLGPDGSTAAPNGGYGLQIHDADEVRLVENTLSANRGGLYGNKGANGMYVQGNHIGTDVTGQLPRGNAYHGALISGDGVSVVESVLSGNLASGLALGYWASGAQIVSNVAGLDATGAAILPNYGFGLWIQGSQSVVDGNVIGGNRDWSGLMLTVGDQNWVKNNWIGTNRDGAPGLGNERAGVAVFDGASDNVIGPGNVIAYNGTVGLGYQGADTTGNTVTENAVHGHPFEGMVSWGDSNESVPTPVVARVERASGRAWGTSCADCLVQIYSDDADEGRWFEGATRADADGNWAADIGQPFKGLSVRATATNANGSTSVFGEGGEVPYKCFIPLSRGGGDSVQLAGDRVETEFAFPIKRLDWWGLLPSQRAVFADTE